MSVYQRYDIISFTVSSFPPFLSKMHCGSYIESQPRRPDGKFKAQPAVILLVVLIIIVLLATLCVSPGLRIRLGWLTWAGCTSTRRAARIGRGAGPW